MIQKDKKELAGQITEAVVTDYDFKQEIDTPLEELIGIEPQMPNEDIIPLDEMNSLINVFHNNTQINIGKLKRLRVDLKDSLFLKPLTQLAQAPGIEITLVTADKAYDDTDGSFFEKTGVTLVTPPSANTKLPENLDLKTCAVTLDDRCDIPMRHLGCTTDGHEYKCNAAPEECPRAISCPQSRIVPFDDGIFQRIIMKSNEPVEQAIDIRKNCERPFNPLKHREGLEEIRVRSQHALISKCTITRMTTLLLEMESRLNDRTEDDPQLTIFHTAA